MKLTYKPALASVAIASLVLAGGCCTKRSQSAYYSRPERAAYASMPEAPPPTPTGRIEPTSNMVVPLYQESINVGKREVDAGSVRLRKIIKTETVNQPVELRHEEVVIDRENGSGQPTQNQALSQPFQEGETVIHLTREEPVIEKQTSPAGQIVVQTRSAAEQTNIQAMVRREDIDVAKQGNTRNVIISENIHRSGRAYESSGGAESTGGETTGAASASGLITDPTTLTASSDSSSLTGRQVQLSGLKVRRTAGDRLLVLSAGDGRPIYVVNNEKTATVKTGDLVDVTGTVKATSSVNAELSGQAAQELSSKPFYIDAQKIELRE
jgi:uncharacterized protein (TIGR02271 family)